MNCLWGRAGVPQTDVPAGIEGLSEEEPAEEHGAEGSEDVTSHDAIGSELETAPSIPLPPREMLDLATVDPPEESAEVATTRVEAEEQSGAAGRGRRG